MVESVEGVDITIEGNTMICLATVGIFDLNATALTGTPKIVNNVMINTDTTTEKSLVVNAGTVCVTANNCFGQITAAGVAACNTDMAGSFRLNDWAIDIEAVGSVRSGSAITSWT